MLVRRSHAVRHIVGRSFLGLALGAGAAALAALPGASPAGAVTCVAAGSTGLTAFMTVASNMTGGTINATGCDVGLYVATSGVSISGVTVSGANDEGILAENATGLTITGNTVENNGVNPNKLIPDGHALMLDGVSTSTITNNIVKNNGNGGIGLADTGPVDPGALTQNSGATPVASTSDTISGNTATGNTGGCGIIVEAWDPGAGISGAMVLNNTVTGAVGQFGPRSEERRVGKEGRSRWSPDH